MKEILFTRQIHDADRVGRHFDIRLVDGEVAYSWATKKELPEPGKIIMVFKQPNHDAKYALSERIIIPKGQYGSGTTVLDTVKRATLHPDSTTDKIKLTTSDGVSFLIKKMEAEKYGKNAWLLRNITGSKNNRYLDKVV